MDKREPIIPARLDYKNAVAGLKAINQGGHVASDLEHAANAASAQFRKTYESIKSASQEFLELKQALQQVTAQELQPNTGGSTADGIKTTAAPLISEGWHNVVEEFPSNAESRTGRASLRLTHERTAIASQELTLLLKTRHPSSQVAESSGSLPDDGNEPQTSEKLVRLPSAIAKGGSREEGFDAGAAPRLREEASIRGFSADWGLKNGIGPSREIRPFAKDLQAHRGQSENFEVQAEQHGILADRREKHSLMRGTAYDGVDSSVSQRSDRSGREAPADLAKWAFEEHGGNEEQLAAVRQARNAAVGTVPDSAQRDSLAIQEEAQTRLNNEAVPEGLDARGGIRRRRSSFPIAAPIDEGLALDWPTQLTRGRNGFLSGESNRNTPLGNTATPSVIERLLREQNDLIRQDLQRKAHPPIAAPPPLRGGGIRMGG